MSHDDTCALYVYSVAVQVSSHEMSAFAFLFGVCRSVVENAKMKYEHNHLLTKYPFLQFGAIAIVDVSCQQGFNSAGTFRSRNKGIGALS